MKCCRKLRDLCRRPDAGRTRIEWAGVVLEFDVSLTAEQIAEFIRRFEMPAHGEGDRGC